MFFAFASALVIQFRNIQARIRNASWPNSEMVDLLEKLNQHLSITRKAICELVNYFSIMLVFFVSCIFVQAVTYSQLAIRIFSGKETNIYIRQF